MRKKSALNGVAHNIAQRGIENWSLNTYLRKMAYLDNCDHITVNLLEHNPYDGAYVVSKILLKMTRSYRRSFEEMLVRHGYNLEYIKQVTITFYFNGKRSTYANSAEGSITTTNGREYKRIAHMFQMQKDRHPFGPKWLPVDATPLYESRFKVPEPTHTPSGLPILDPPDWVSCRKAAKELKLLELRIPRLIKVGRLKPCANAFGDEGITRQSLDTEKQWRTESNVLQKTLRAVNEITYR